MEKFTMEDDDPSISLSAVISPAPLLLHTSTARSLPWATLAPKPTTATPSNAPATGQAHRHFFRRPSARSSKDAGSNSSGSGSRDPPGSFIGGTGGHGGLGGLGGFGSHRGPARAVLEGPLSPAAFCAVTT